jgi:pseudouridine-5'-phosphate glycosidase/pseudouridine kinase
MPSAANVSTDIRKRQQGDKVDAVVVGAIAYDLTCTMKTFIAPGILIGSSHPSSIASSIGGVAHNVALAAQYASESGSGAKIRLVSAVGSDSKTILDLVSHSLDISGICVDEQQPTPKYVSVNDVRGQLVVACADMDLIENMETEHIASEIKRAQPKCVLFDGNLGMKQTKTVLETARSIPGCMIMFEPTSEFKASLMSRQSLQLFPHCSIDVASPNYIELGGMYAAFEKSSKFTGDRWRQITTGIDLKQQIKFASDDLSEKIPELNPLIRSGLVEHAFHLLPYFPNLFVKMGPRGIINFQLFEDMESVTQPSKGTELEGSNRFVSSISIWGEKNMGILIQHFPPYPLGDTPVISVNGAGDTLCGAILSELARDRVWLRDSQSRKIDVMERAQQAAVLSLGTTHSVSPEIRHLYPKSSRRQ